MDIKLGLYETIDKRFDEWLNFDNALKLYFITSDIEIYGKEKFKKSIYRVGSVSVNKLDQLIKEFKSVPKSNKVQLKKIYLEFIETICKPDKKQAPLQIEQVDGDRTENYSVTDEYEAIKEQVEIEEEIIEERLVFEEKANQLEKLIQKAKLSDIEIYALNFLKSERKERHLFLYNFTANGIIQIANRAAYKLFWVNRTF
jgi:hypothetical protein